MKVDDCTLIKQLCHEQIVENDDRIVASWYDRNTFVHIFFINKSNARQNYLNRCLLMHEPYDFLANSRVLNTANGHIAERIDRCLSQ